MLGVLNFLCFMKCQGEHRQKIKELADKVGLASAHSLVDY
jgi:translation initiation factor 1 (eIF-1/SUI1)